VFGLVVERRATSDLTRSRESGAPRQSKAGAKCGAVNSSTALSRSAPLPQGQGPCSLIASLKSSPSERKGGVVPSIDFRNTSRSACWSAVNVFAIVVIGGEIFPSGPQPCTGDTPPPGWAWPRGGDGGP